jgi:hypothetical protein
MFSLELKAFTYSKLILIYHTIEVSLVDYN